MKQIIIDFLKRKSTKMFFWNALAGFLSILAIYLGELDPLYNVILVPAILATTKFINQKYSN